MRLLHALFPLAAIALAGCNRAPAPPVVIVEGGGGSSMSAEEPAAAPTLPAAKIDRSPLDRYEAAMWTAVARLNENKPAEALAAFEKARSLRDTAAVQDAIAATRVRLEDAAAVHRLTADIRALLLDGHVEEAARHAADAIRCCAETDASTALAALKRQADVLAAGSLAPNARIARFRKEAEDAAAAGDYRSAALAYEQILAQTSDPALSQKNEEIVGRIRRHDSAQRQADEFRRDPLHLEYAIASLADAAQTWDTLDVRRGLGECTLALQSRRERLGICDFDIRGDVGAIAVARKAAEELSAAFKDRFELVDRGQHTQVLEELKLGADGLIVDDIGRWAVARLAQVRYLVLGRVTTVCGATVQALLIDLRTGLIVQTAHVTAPTTDAVMPMLPALAAMLQMNHEQRQAYESQLAGVYSPPAVVADLESVPPELEGAANAPAQPIFVGSFRPPDAGGVKLDDFRGLTIKDALSPAAINKEHVARARAFAIAMTLGDNLLRRGLYFDAHLQYQVALGLSASAAGLSARIDKCRPFLPAAAAGTLRPRVAVLDFFADGDAATGAPAIGAWCADHVAAYLSPPYTNVPRTETSWYLARLGLTLRDIVVDSAARFYLGRALDSRYIVVGTLRRDSGGFGATGYLLDAETGARISVTEIRAADRDELHVRLAELARGLLVGPGESSVRAEHTRARTLLVEARQQARQGNLIAAVEQIQQAGKLNPGSVELRVELERWRTQYRQIELEAQRRAAFARWRELAESVRARRAAVMQAAARAAKEAPPPASVADFARLRDQAGVQLVSQARAARSVNDYAFAVQLFESGIGLLPSDELFHELAQARTMAAAQIRARADAEAATRAEALLRRRDAELKQIRAQFETESRQRAVTDQARLQSLRDPDRLEYVRLISEAEAAQTKEEWEKVLDALQSARRIKPGDEVERKIMSARTAQARAIAKEQGERAVLDLEARLASEAAARIKLDAQIKRNLNFYTESMRMAEQSLRYKHFDQAAKQFQDALKHIRADAALNGLRQVEEEKARAKAAAEAAAKRAEAERQADNEAARLVVLGRVAYDAGNFEEAIATFQKAKELSASNLDAVAWCAKAEQARLDKLAAERRPGGNTAIAAAKVASPAERESSNPQAAAAKTKEADSAAKDDPAKRLREDFNHLLDLGRTALQARRFDEAATTFADALKLIPGDAEATELLKQARDAVKLRDSSPVYTQHMQSASAFEKQENFEEAIVAYKAALAVVPNDPTATKRLDYAQHMLAGARLLRAGKKSDAAKEFEAALRAAPNDPAAAKALLKAKP